MVLVDVQRLESAVLNLVINSRDAMPNGGKLVISSNNVMINNPYKIEKGYLDHGRYIIISVKDSGSGMNEDIRQQVTEPFFSTKTSTAGTGLGLSMVYDFVLHSEGGLCISSQVGKGTTIDLVLPVLETIEDLQLNYDGESTEISGGNETVLVVEDREKVRRFACRSLKRLGYQLLEAKNAEEALEYFQSDNKIDLLFTDIVMPGDMNGRKLANFVSTKNKSLKVLLTTGMEIHEDAEEDAGLPFLVLSKPYTVEKLAIYVRKALDTNQTNELI